MDINFTKVDGAYVSEFEVTADFNLHMDDILLKDVTIYQRSAGAGYDVVRDVPTFPIFAKVFDYDFSALVYPKYIKVVCNTEPTYASVVTDGEITEIKSQSKSVDVTSNGVTEVTPDSGYSYLTGVSVNVNVPQEGGGGSESTMEYLNVSGLDISEDSKWIALLVYGIQAKSKMSNSLACVPVGLAQQMLEMATIEAIAIDFNLQTNVFMGSLKSTKDYILTMPVPSEDNRITEEELIAIPRITKEEFYTI